MRKFIEKTKMNFLKTKNPSQIFFILNFQKKEHWKIQKKSVFSEKDENSSKIVENPLLAFFLFPFLNAVDLNVDLNPSRRKFFIWKVRGDMKFMKKLSWFFF